MITEETRKALEEASDSKNIYIDIGKKWDDPKTGSIVVLDYDNKPEDDIYSVIYHDEGFHVDNVEEAVIELIEFLGGK